MHRIALVPGFLGFNHNGEVTYFADRFIAGLRASVETAVGRSVPVTPIAMSPIASLKQRQEELITALDAIDSTAEWHLIGHSTGGLDAALLLRGQKLDYARAKGSFFSDQPLHAPNIRSVTTISTPHYGTCISRAPAVKTTRTGASVGERVKGGLSLFGLLRGLERDQLWSRIKFGGGIVGGSSKDFFQHLLFGNDLLRDLDPSIAATLTATSNKQNPAPVFSVATIAPNPGERKTKDRLFTLLWQWTQLAAATAVPKAPPTGQPQVRIASDMNLLPMVGAAIGPRDNDGVVNTDRQVYGAFAGLVSADHCDVLGRYTRQDPLDGKTVDPGLLTSGADFGDDEFFKLIELVARGIAGEVSNTVRLAAVPAVSASSGVRPDLTVEQFRS